MCMCMTFRICLHRNVDNAACKQDCAVSLLWEQDEIYFKLCFRRLFGQTTTAAVFYICMYVYVYI